MQISNLPLTQYLKCIALVLLLMLAIPVHAAEVKEKLPSELYGIAEFRTGKVDKPAILILHGFLTTYNFNTVLGAIEMLSDNGYSVLAPNLSLGINARNQGLPCDAIHTHTIEQDLVEIGFWVEWLVGKGYKNVILIGHSIGSLELLAYASGKPHAAISRLIATSMSFANNFNPDEVVKRQISLAKEYKEKGDRSLYAYTLSYCKSNFMAPAEVYLSYTRWNKEEVLNELKKVSFPTHIIMGGSDKRFDKAWLDELEKAGADMTVIPGANHFFDAQHEFDLHDTFLEILEQGE